MSASLLRLRAKKGGAVVLQNWVTQGAYLDIDFANNRAWHAGTYPTIASLVSITRTTTGLVDNLSGVWTEIAPNFLRISNKGLLAEPNVLNVVIHNRALNITHQLTVTGVSGAFVSGETLEATGGGSGVYSVTQSSVTAVALSGGTGTFTGTLTGAISGAAATITASALVWVKTNVTAAKDQVGINGQGGQASRITATAGNATVLQSITHSGRPRWTSCSVKRLVGSGVIQMTMDNGATWTAIPVSAGWTRVSIPTQTLANPIVGFRIVTSGDSIAVDAVQIEESALFGTSPIFTTTASVVRNIDQLSFLQSLLPSWGSATVILEMLWPPITTASRIFLEGESTSGLTFSANASGVSPRVIIRQGATSRQDETPAVTPAAGEVVRIGATWDPTAAGRGAANDVHTAGVAATQIDFTGTKIFLGSRAGTSQFMGSYIRRLIVMPHRMPDAQFDARTRPSFEFENAEAAVLVASFFAVPDEAHNRYIDTLIGSLKVADVWDKLDAFYVFAVHDSLAALRNWKNPGVLDAVPVFAPTFTVDRGYVGNGTSSRLTSLTPSTQGVRFTLNSASMGLWSRTSDQIAAASMGSIAGSTTNQIVLRSATDNIAYRMNDGTTSSIANLDGSGFFVAVRPNSSTKRMYRNGAQIGSDASVVSTSLATLPMWIGGSNSSNFSTAEIAAAFIGGALTAGEVADLYDALNVYMLAVGAV